MFSRCYTLRAGNTQNITRTRLTSYATNLLLTLILLLMGLLPAWPYSTGWGYYPSGGDGLILLIVIILALLGRV